MVTAPRFGKKKMLIGESFMAQPGDPSLRWPLRGVVAKPGPGCQTERPMTLRRLLPAFLFATVCPAPAQSVPAAAANPAIRAVWVQQLSGEPDSRGQGSSFRLMASEIPASPAPRVLLAGPQNISRPLLSADGSTVYFTNRNATTTGEGIAYQPEIFGIPFSGGEPTKLGSGMAVAVWRAPDVSEFLYALSTLQTSRRPGLTGDILVRFHPEKPDDREIVWTTTPLGADNFQLSRDGTRAAGLFPWPQAGLADMNSQTFSALAQGSFPSLAPDDSYALFVLDGDRRRLRFFVPAVDPGWDLQPTVLLPRKDGEINQPRWTNDPRYLTFSGPAATGDSTDVYLARMRADLRGFEQVTPLSSDPAPDYFPDVWVAGGHTQISSLTQRPAIIAAPAAASWPVVKDGLLFSWENGGAPGAADRFQLHGFACPGRNAALNVSGGWAEAQGDDARHISEACAKSGAFTMEALITERRTVAPCSLRLLCLQSADGRDACALYRVDGALVLRLLTGGADGKPAIIERHLLTTLSIEDDRPLSLTLTGGAGRVQCYIDGRRMKEIVLDQPGLQAWKDLRLIAGDPQPYGTPWTGQLERIAIYSRALAEAEVSDAWRNTESLLITRQRPTRNKIKARLIEMPPLPDDATLAASPLWLHASTWAVEQVFSGYVQHKKITLLQWASMNGKRAPLPEMKPGQSIELPIEMLEDHPELRDIKTHHATAGGELPLFFDTTPPGRYGKPFPSP